MPSYMKCVAAALASGATLTSASATEGGCFAPTNGLCGSGSQQSPIDLHPCMKEVEQDGKMEKFNIPMERPKIETASYWSGKTEVTKVCADDGCYVDVTPSSAIETSYGTFSIEGAGKYYLDKCSVRIPSEHTVNHNHYAMEVQCLHTEDGTDGRRKGILSTLFEVTDKPSGFASQLLNQMPADPAFPTAATSFGFNSFLGTAGKSRYYSYKGSRTVGDCSEDVDWFIMYDPVAISQGQIDSLTKNMSHHENGWKPSRCLQSLYGRHPDGCIHHKAADPVPYGVDMGPLIAIVIALFIFIPGLVPCVWVMKKVYNQIFTKEDKDGTQ